MFKTFSELTTYLDNAIPKTNLERFPGEFGLKRTKNLLETLGNPETKFKVIHVAGTSGKGSTAYCLEAVLRGLGLRTALTVSPHLLSLTERVQIAGTAITEEKFLEYFNEIYPVVETLKETDYGSFTFFELLTAFEFYVFAREKVEYAIVEVGLGGLLDATNVFEGVEKISVITRLGFDHTHILGNTLAEIATQKAGIIKEGNTVVTIVQEPEAREVLLRHVVEKDAEFIELADTDYALRSVNQEILIFNYKQLTGQLQIKLPIPATYLVENCALALKVAEIIAVREGQSITQELVDQVLVKIEIPGRFRVSSHLG